MMLDKALSPSHLLKATAAIGRFYDYYHSDKNNDIISTYDKTKLVAKFYEARKNGIASLNWNTVRNRTAAADVRFINEFSDFCAENFGHINLNPKDIAHVTELPVKRQVAERARRSGRVNWDILFHLTPSTCHGKGLLETRPFIPPNGEKNSQQSFPVSFPTHKILPLLSATISLRDKLYFMLMFFGGLRISEPLHIFVNDISVREDGVALVIVGHPQDGTFEWVSNSGRQQRGTRGTFLKQKYGMGPRHLLAEKDPMHAGFKGMTFDNGRRKEAEVHWLWADAGRRFALLHMEYMNTVRAHLVDNHPYYFVNNSSSSHFGSPLKISNIDKAFTRAMRRVGLIPYKDGAHPHGARHFYGYFLASILRVPVELAQKLMHHATQSSTEIYYHLDVAVAKEELRRGYERMTAVTSTVIDNLISFMRD